jgi:hypothetical protein
MDGKHNEESPNPPAIEVVVEDHAPTDDKQHSKINYYGHEKRGFSPMGMAAVVKAAGVEKVTYWHRGKSPYTYGVLMFQPRVTQKAVEEVICKISSVYPVNDGIKRMAVIVFEKNSMRGAHTTLRHTHNTPPTF